MDEPPRLAVHFDPIHDCLTIEGIKYAGLMFRGLARWPIGTRLEILKREDGMVTVRRFGKFRTRTQARDDNPEQHENGDGV